MSSIFKVTGLCKNYPAFSLKNVSFDLEEGKITGFIGRNGAGKTTTLKSSLGFVHADSGTAEFFGMDMRNNAEKIKQDIGYVSGGVSFYPHKKLRQITAVTKQFYKSWDDNVYAECLRKFALDENKTPSQLSEGMKVKYSIALALSHNARLLILDEPTSGLDPISRDELLDIFLGLSDSGTTILFSTHITSDLEKCADNIIYIKSGEIAADTTMKKFVDDYSAVSLTAEEYQKADKSVLIGCKRSKEGYTAIVRKGTQTVGSVTPADAETIMIHLEHKEN